MDKSPLSVYSLSSFLVLNFLVYTGYQIIWLRNKMAGRAVAALVVLCIAYMTVLAQTPTSTSFRSIFTVPSNADNSVPLLPNIYDSEAVNSQDACPSYMASNIVRTSYGFTAKLALAESYLQLI